MKSTSIKKIGESTFTPFSTVTYDITKVQSVLVTRFLRGQISQSLRLKEG